MDTDTGCTLFQLYSPPSCVALSIKIWTLIWSIDVSLSVKHISLPSVSGRNVWIFMVLQSYREKGDLTYSQTISATIFYSAFLGHRNTLSISLGHWGSRDLCGILGFPINAIISVSWCRSTVSVPMTVPGILALLLAFSEFPDGLTLILPMLLS